MRLHHAEVWIHSKMFHAKTRCVRVKMAHQILQQILGKHKSASSELAV